MIRVQSRVARQASIRDGHIKVYRDHEYRHGAQQQPSMELVRDVDRRVDRRLLDLDEVGVVRVRDGLPLDPVRLCEVGW